MFSPPEVVGRGGETQVQMVEIRIQVQVGAWQIRRKLIMTN